MVNASTTCYAGYAPGQWLIMCKPQRKRNEKVIQSKTFYFLALKGSRPMMSKFKEYLSLNMRQPQADLLLVTMCTMALNGEDDQTILLALDKLGLQYTKQAKSVHDGKLVATMAEGDNGLTGKHCTVVSDSRTIVRDDMFGAPQVKITYDDPYSISRPIKKPSSSVIFFQMLSRMPEHLIEEYLALLSQGGVLGVYDSDPRYISDALVKVQLMLEGLCNQEQTSTSYALTDHMLRPFEDWERFFRARGFVPVYKSEIDPEVGTFHLIMTKPRVTLTGKEIWYTGLANCYREDDIKYHGYVIHEEDEIESLIEDAQDY